MHSGNGPASSIATTGTVGRLPSSDAARFQASAIPGESLIAWLQTDLDAELRYANGLVILTDRRLISFASTHGPLSPAADAQTWTLDASTNLQAEEHAGVGTLELFAGDARVAR